MRARLDALIRDRGRPDLPPDERPAVAFDFDNTCIRNDVGEALFVALVEQGRLRPSEAVWRDVPESERHAAREACGALPRPGDDACLAAMLLAYEGVTREHGGAASSAWLVRAMAGLTADDIREAARAVLDRQLAAPLSTRELAFEETRARIFDGIRYYTEIRDLMMELRRAGFDVWVISASCEWAVEEAARSLGVDPDHVVGVRAVLDGDGRLTDRVEELVTYGPGKVEAIRRHVRRTPMLAFGDASTDVQMLSAASAFAVLVDRGNESLRAEARARGWLLQPRFRVEGE